MTTVLLLISDGREDAEARCLRSMELMVPPVDHVVHVDDADHRLGFDGAIREGWQRIRRIRPIPRYCLHLEADFVFLEPVDLAGMADLLDRQPDVAQVALKRQAVNQEELAAGGIVELSPDDFTERSDGRATWMEHRRWWTTNPSLYRTELVHAADWPVGPDSEGRFTHMLLRDPGLRFAIWGAKFDPPRVEHIGVRVGVGY